MEMRLNVRVRRIRPAAAQKRRPAPDRHLFLCLFFLSFFLRLWVAIFLSLRFLPQGTSMSPWAPGPVIKSLPNMNQTKRNVKGTPALFQRFYFEEI
jgi:hypothetical protein